MSQVIGSQSFGRSNVIIPWGGNWKYFIALSLSIFSFLLAACIYLFNRETSNFLYQAFAFAGVSPEVDALRKCIPNMPAWFVYSLPDGLWMFSFSMVIFTIWGFQRSREAIAWIMTTLAIGGLFEFSQALNIIPGQFDWADLAFIFIAVLLPLCFTLKSNSL